VIYRKTVTTAVVQKNFKYPSIDAMV